MKLQIAKLEISVGFNLADFGMTLSAELQLCSWEQNRFKTFLKKKPNKLTTKKESKVQYKNRTP
jgi:hypothetical protein